MQKTEKQKASMRAWRLAHREEQSAWRKAYYLKNKKRIAEHKKITYQAQKEKFKIRALKTNRQLKLLIMKHYSGEVPSCAHCGVNDMDVLCIDHIKGGGNAHRKATKTSSGTRFYRWLKNNGFPTGFQVLCANCNLKKRFAVRLVGENRNEEP